MILSPPWLFILHLKSPTAWRLKCALGTNRWICFARMTLNMNVKKKIFISFSSQQHLWRCLDFAARCIYFFFFFFTKWGSEDCVASLLERPWCGTNVFSLKQRGSVFFFFFPLTGLPCLFFVCQDFVLPLLYFTLFFFFLPKISSSAQWMRRIFSRQWDHY